MIRRWSLADRRRRYAVEVRAAQLRSRPVINYARCWRFQFLAAAFEQMRVMRFERFLRESPWL